FGLGVGDVGGGGGGVGGPACCLVCGAALSEESEIYMEGGRVMGCESCWERGPAGELKPEWFWGGGEDE
ncbi:MAG: hypothetical protein PHO10_03020, partial [Gemmiger sp.]|nr:hypothetical protein [Gemmiger sp.]